MVNTKNTVNHIISPFFFIVVVISFFLLIKSGEYRNFIIFVLAASSFLLGYFIRRRNDNLGEDDIETKKEKNENPSTILLNQKFPQEFLDEQERYKKLSLENKGKEKTGQ